MTAIACRNGLSAFVAAGLVFVACAPVNATESPNILGTYTGVSNEVDSGRSDPADNGPFSSALTFVIDFQSGATFSGKVIDQEGDVTTINPSSVLPGGSVSGSFFSDDQSGTFGGTLSGDTLDLSFFASDVPPDCTTNGTVAATRGSTVVPAVAPGTEVTGDRRVQAAARTYAAALSGRVATFLGERGTGATPLADGFMLQGATSGASAGDAPLYPVGVWGSYSRSDAKNTLPTASFDTDYNLFIGGVDFSPVDNMVVGLTFGYENGSTDTYFNGGQQDVDGVTFGPYIGALLTDTISFDFAATTSWLSFDQSRTDTATGANVVSDPDGRRFFMSGNFNATTAVDAWLFSGRVGMLWASDTVEAFQESNSTLVERNESKLGQLRVAAEMAYAVGDLEPYVGGTYEFDFSRSGVTLAPGLVQPSDDDSGFVVNVGLRYYGAETMSGTLEYTKVLGRSDYEQGTIMFMLRGDF